MCNFKYYENYLFNKRDSCIPKVTSKMISVTLINTSMDYYLSVKSSNSSGQAGRVAVRLACW